MAKEAAKPQAKTAPAKKKGGRGKLILVMILLGVAATFMLPTVVLVLAALFPTYVAFATDDHPQKAGAVSVFAMNTAGVTPFVIDLWHKGQTMPNAVAIMTDSKSWLVILGAAAVGQLIVYTIPHAIATVTLAQAESRIKTLRKNLDLLKDSWGPGVATTKPVDQMERD